MSNQLLVSKSHSSFETLSLENASKTFVWEEVRAKGLYEPIFFYLVSTVKDKKPENLGGCKFAPMPGCCGIVISTELFLNPSRWGCGYSQPFQELKYLLAQKMGYSKILATVEMSNLREVFSAKKAGWKFLSTFMNPRTNHLLGLMERDIAPLSPKELLEV